MSTGLIFPEAVLNQHLIVLGKTGAGKSSALRHIVEHLLTQQKRVCIIDPKGDWYGLKSSADGKGAGFPVVLFGDFKNPDARDVPVNEYSGRPVAELVVGGNRPCVIGFRGWTQGAMHRFWIDFASVLFNSNGGELYFVVDEVHNFAPKGKVLSPEVGKCLHWANRIMNEGRGLGLVNLIASQRPQKVHNDTLTACETLVSMRVVHTRDRDAVEEWVEGCGDPKTGKDVLGTLAGMKRGEAWIWSPEVGFGPERVTFPMFLTYDSFAPPQLLKKISQKGWADVDLSEVKAKLASAIEKAKAEDPKELTRQIVDLKKQLAAKPPAPPKTIETIKEVEKPVLKDAELQRLELVGEKLVTAAAQMADVAKEITQALSKFSTNGHKPVAQRSAPVPRPLPNRQPVTQHQQAEFSGQMPTGEEKILSALIQYPDGLERSQLTVLTTFKRSTRDLYLQRLAQKGYVVSSGKKMLATDAGRAAVPNAQPLPTGEALQQHWLARLPEGERSILSVVIDSYPNAVSRDAISERTGYKKSTRDLYLQRLQSKQIVIASRGDVTAHSDLF